MSSLIRNMRNLIRRPWVPIQLPATRPEIADKDGWLDEEQFEEFRIEKRFFPVKIGDLYESRYQIVGKLGFGTTSTVWLARDLKKRTHVSLKIYIRGGFAKSEYEIYRKLKDTWSSNPGYHHVRTALDLFSIRHNENEHHVLVQEPMWDDFRNLMRRNPAGRFPEELLKPALRQLFQALDYLHSDCKLVHTDIKADNMFVGIGDPELYDGYVKAEMREPAPRKTVDGMPVYASRQFGVGDAVGAAFLGDFGSAVRGDEVNSHDAQPDVYRCPEVMLEVDWSYPVDIWNVGTLIWDLFEGRHMFYGSGDPNGKPYMTRMHLAEVTALLGPPPLDFLNRGKRSHEFFDADGNWIAPVPMPTENSLEASEERLEGESKKNFMRFMRKMLQWRPEDRQTAKQLLEDPWLKSPCI